MCHAEVLRSICVPQPDPSEYLRMTTAFADATASCTSFQELDVGCSYTIAGGRSLLAANTGATRDSAGFLRRKGTCVMGRFDDLFKTARRPMHSVDQLAFWLEQFLGLRVPRKPMCAHHVAPFKYLERAYFEPA